jgi:predicted nucleotidyltransferase
MCTINELKHITDSVTKTAKEMFREKLDRVILYGSYARGDHDEGSDIDIMVLVDLTANELIPYRWKMALFSSNLSLESEDCVTVSISLKDKETFTKHQDTLPYYQTVLKEGVVLYAA